VVKAVSEEDYKQWVAEQKSKQGATAAAPVQVAAADTAAKSDATSAKVDGKATYQQICQVCHAAALMGAPKPGDKAAWAPRIAQGLPTLHEHANKGIRSMPAKGGNPSLSDDQVNAAVDYMVSLAK